MLEKTYDPQSFEEKLYAAWESDGDFRADSKSAKKPFCIVIPPPNVTGSLHIGHALNNTLQDVLVRYWRMKGRDVLWQAGTDHAGIATQMVVERQLEASGTSRRALGRDAFVSRVWSWKEQSGGIITHQLRRLGVSPDWTRERFTMDEGLSQAVRKVFVELYRQGLIYRDKRLVNWDPKLLTAISDLEVENREVRGKMWYFKYPIEGQDGAYIVVGTTRPETMLGDTAVAVHPDDERYNALVGRHCVLPLVGRRIPIVADEYANPEKGSGAVKITPGHDFNDFAVAKRHDLPLVNVFDQFGKLNDNAPEQFRGQDRFKVRDAVVAAMEEKGLLERVEDNVMTVPYGDRSGVVIEPWLTDQWYCDAKTLAQPCIKAVEDGRTRFVPKTWENTFFEWMRNIQPWCISRQLWWGHQVPAWYGPDGKVFVGMDEGEATAEANAHYGKSVVLARDEDVLDTWFSSALWPFSTLGWPAQSHDVARYYPTDVLVTGFDIIFFWVARMMMMGLHFMKDVPFRDVYIHALVRDEKGQKMSKSKGNVMDPLDLCNKFGTDAVRFSLTAMAAQGRDIKLSENRIAGYRNFITKIWNAARFCQMNGCAAVAGFDPQGVTTTLNRWIVGKTGEAAVNVAAAIESYKFNEAATGVYQFTWGTFCDWYLEFAKPVFQGADEVAKAETRATAAWVLEQILHIAHPVIPFVTEELWAQLAKEQGLVRPSKLIRAAWPEIAGMAANDAAAEMDWVVEVISAIRSVRAEMNVPPGTMLKAQAKGLSAGLEARLAAHRALICANARLSEIAPSGNPDTSGAAQVVVGEVTIVLPLAGVIDLAKERDRLKKEIAKLDGEIAAVDRKLANESFVAKAPPEVIEENRDRRLIAANAQAKLKDALARIS